MDSAFGDSLRLVSVCDSARLIGQFVVSAGRSRGPREWVTDRIGEWFLCRHPALPLIRLVGVEGGPLGWILGYPISEAGRLLSDHEVLQLPPQALASTEALETFIYSFGGRFAVVVSDARHRRLYLDPCGSLSAVYCAHQRMVASTPNLIPYDDHTRDRVELAQAIGIPHTNGMYPFGLTPRYGIERILPNHYLDLSEWQTVRHWPKQAWQEATRVEDTAAEIANLVKRNIAAIVAATPTYLPLTAGWDSRMLLACAKEWAYRLELFTTEIGDKGATIDCDTARRIAKRLDLKHRVLPREGAREVDLEEWMFRISYSTGEVRGWQSATMYKRLPGGHAVLVGNIGDLGRRHLWWGRGNNVETSLIAPERLIELCRCPPVEPPLARARAWLDSLPTAEVLQVLDLAYIEQRLGCWAGVFPYAECDPGFTVFPLCHREIIERILKLPVPYRRAGHLPRDIINREWSTLLEWPVNQPIGAARLRLGVKKAVSEAVAAWGRAESGIIKWRGTIAGSVR